MFLSGNDAAAYGARLARPQVIAAYPITPQSPIYERLSAWDGEGSLGAIMMRVESEHSAMAACISASLTGVRTFTATASQGIALMHELLHYASGMRVPIVLVNVNRSLAAPWSFWSDQTDSLSQRDTGWLQLYVADNQEALDTVIQAYRISETVLLPTMVVLEGFYTSHFMEPVEVPEQESVDEFLPAFKPAFTLDTHQPATFCQTVTQRQYAEFKIARQSAMIDALEVVEAVDREYGERFGREYGVLNCYRHDDAEIVLVTAGTIGSTAKEAIDELREGGKKVGLVRIRLFRPFPKARVVESLKHAKRVAVIDRNLSPGQEGVFSEELKSALYSRVDNAPVFSFVLGLGGTNVSTSCIRRVFELTEKMQNVPVNPIFDIENDDALGF
jgi:pyruvate/2-oxoacid:ferredoxin oxidoreductase alpha subunit